MAEILQIGPSRESVMRAVAAKLPERREDQAHQ
jgi:hypothetical protein